MMRLNPSACPAASRRLSALLAAGLLISLFGIATAQAQPAGDELAAVCAGERQQFSLPPLTRFDEDGNRRLSADEAQQCAIVAALFERLDLDGDGGLSATEYDALPGVWRRRARALEDPEP